MTTTAYQHFLDFFDMHNRERLDGLDEGYFSSMTTDERARAFEHMQNMFDKGGSDEVVHGLFLADSTRAEQVVAQLLRDGKLNDSAELLAAYHLYGIHRDPSLIATFIKHMTNPRKYIRADAVYFAPADGFDPELNAALKAVIRTDTFSLAAIHATNKLLECYGITCDSVPEEDFLRYYNGLRSDDPTIVEETLKSLDAFYGI